MPVEPFKLLEISILPRNDHYNCSEVEKATSEEGDIPVMEG